MISDDALVHRISVYHRLRVLNRWIWLAILIVGVGVSIILCTAIGPTGLSALITQNSGLSLLIIKEIRLPRVIAAVLVGAGLASAGTAMQGLFRNSLADPYVIGTSSGAALGAALSFVLLGGAFLPLAAFFGACGSTLIVYLIARQNNRVSTAMLLLSGVAISFFLSAMLSFLMFRAGENLHQIMFWLMGGFWNTGWDSVTTGLLIIPGILALILCSRELDLLSLGDEEAATLGVETEHIKIALLALSAFLTGIAVSIAGSIGFIGLIIPHLVRSITGPGHRFLIPASAVTGGIVLLWADTASRTLLNDMPVGIITALLGAPFFLYLIKKRGSL
jgi:iron complex transport system permease protein